MRAECLCLGQPEHPVFWDPEEGGGLAVVIWVETVGPAAEREVSALGILLSLFCVDSLTFVWMLSNSGM